MVPGRGPRGAAPEGGALDAEADEAEGEEEGEDGELPEGDSPGGPPDSFVVPTNELDLERERRPLLGARADGPPASARGA